MDIVEDDLEDAGTLELLALHLAGMHEHSPACHVHALDVSRLKAPNVTFWTARSGGRVAGMAALRMLGDGSGELKSMRTHPDFLRQGVAAALLEHVITTARTRGLSRLSLETGSGPGFDAALALYRRRGFENGPAFGGYEASDFNQFLQLELT
ncbi:GNAT family N-acetyltransferase [Caulobacter sp. NIBR2454]|uniref:GNAT family N-acetyltransferase n=1 Tax=Caulobacter sp. NIBR2454 TaxID=3015996 RepID=UPI0022B695C0|nr:GNAT family N-acetyltransferase [Caulobacter sp. NIBR2454]